MPERVPCGRGSGCSRSGARRCVWKSEVAVAALSIGQRVVGLARRW
jgi:hypothetical protein